MADGGERGLEVGEGLDAVDLASVDAPLDVMGRNLGLFSPCGFTRDMGRKGGDKGLEAGHVREVGILASGRGVARRGHDGGRRV